MTNPKLIPMDMFRRAEKLRNRARDLKLSANSLSVDRSPMAQRLVDALDHHALTLDRLADEIEAWANGIT